MRKQFETHSRGRINDGRLIRSGQRYYVRYMDHGDLKHSLDLQDHVLEVLEELGKTHYIIEKSENYLKKLLDSGHAIIGTFVHDSDPNNEDRLATHMLVLYPQSEDDTGLADTSVLPCSDPGKLSVVSNILVHQDFRGNRLMQQMLAEWLKIAAADGKSDAVAEVCADNEFSWGVFVDCGFVIYAASHDERDGAELVYVHKPLDRKFVYGAAPGDTARITLFDEHSRMDETAYLQLQDFLKQGYHATGFDRRSKVLTLQKCIGSAPLHTPANDNPQPPAP